MDLESSGFDTWWAYTDDVSRKRVLNLEPGDDVPSDLALDMQLHGVRIIAAGVAWSEEDLEWVGLYEQPPEVIAMLAGVSPDCPG